jgi:DNA-binding NarL/FixJ family response regulator
VIFSTFDFEDEVHRAMRAGAAGYLLKNVKPRELVASVLHLHKEGRLPLAPHLAAALSEREKAPDLTLREREVLGLIAKGLTNKDIAGVLGFTTRTAKAHVTSLLVKLDVADRNEATSAAFKRGIVPLD